MFDHMTTLYSNFSVSRWRKSHPPCIRCCSKSVPLMHSQNCQAFSCIVPVHQLSKFKACEICPRVSLKKCKFPTPLLIWMQSDMNMAEFAQQRENCYRLNTVICLHRQQKEWGCLTYSLVNTLNVAHGQRWGFYMELFSSLCVVCCFELNGLFANSSSRSLNSRTGMAAFSLPHFTPSFVKSYYHFGSVWTSPPALLPTGKRARWGLKAACTLLGENVCHQIVLQLHVTDSYRWSVNHICPWQLCPNANL